MAKPGDSLFTTLALAVIFITLGSCRILLIKFSANEDGKYDYLPVTVNVCAEVIKLAVCSVLALHVLCSGGRRWHEVLCLSTPDILQTLKWSVPGCLYFIDNLMSFYIIKYLQPALVVLLGNFVIITTSLLFRLVLGRKLSQVQWASLMVLFLAIVSLSSQGKGNVTADHHKHHAINHLLINHNSSSLILPNKDICHPEEAQFQPRNHSELGQELLDSFQGEPFYKRTFRQFNFHEGHILILVQCLISSTANIYNEKIFKEGDGLEESIYIQNSKLYFFGVIFNLLSLIVHDVYRHKIMACGFFHGHNAYSLILIFVTALYGLNVAFILKFRDNMFHVLSSQMITLIIVCSSIYFFGFKPDLDFFVSSPIVLLAIYIYQKSRPKLKTYIDSGIQSHRLRRMRDIGEEAQELVISADNLRE